MILVHLPVLARVTCNVVYNTTETNAIRSSAEAQVLPELRYTLILSSCACHIYSQRTTG
jgi:hypothetical protein